MSAPIERVAWCARDRETLLLTGGSAPLEIALSVREEEAHYRLELTVAATAPDQLDLVWSHPRFGQVGQRWLARSAPVAGDLLWEIETVLAPERSMSALLVQEFAWRPVAEPFFMIPGALYGTNNIKDSKGKQPQLNYRGDICYPKTPVYRTRADRSSHNAVIAIGDGRVIGARIDESTWQGAAPHYNGLGIDTRNLDAFDRIELTFGYHHFPVRYKGKLYEHAHSAEQEFGWLPLAAGQRCRARSHLYLGAAENRFAYEPVLRAFYGQIHTPPAVDGDRHAAIRDIAGAITRDGYAREHGFFPTVAFSLRGGAPLNPPPSHSGDSAWTGGMQVAYPLLRAARHVPEARAVATDYIDRLVREGVNPASGLLYDAKERDRWKPVGWWQNDVQVYDRMLRRVDLFHSAYVNGQASCFLLKSYRWMLRQGWEHPALPTWLETARRIIDRVIACQRFDGAFGTYFDACNGSPLGYNGFQGCWFLAALAELAAITGEPGYLAAFARAESYYAAFLDRVELWGMPIDTRDAVDEEGNLAYITALKTFHELTGEPRYAERLLHALHYEFSWKFAYNTRHVNEPLRSLGWPSCGGSITSSHNIHIHQMGNLVAEEMFYAYRLTRDSYILSRLRDTLNWGLATYNRADGQFGFGKQGWATEQFFHSDGVQDDIGRVEDGGIWFGYLPWAGACVLLSCAADLPDELFAPAGALADAAPPRAPARQSVPVSICDAAIRG